MTFDIVVADYENLEHGKAIVDLLNQYACDPMGGGQPLNEHTQKQLINGLKQTPTAITLLCFQKSTPIALINAFEGFSTFAAAPLINLHDVYIIPSHRGKGLLALMLENLERIAKERNCCKLTLEVLSNNKVAKAAYKKLGFSGYELLAEAGEAIFWQKQLK